MPNKHELLNKEGKHKKDEFDTRLSGIERELRHYKSQVKDKVVYCNCDDPRISR